MPIAQRGLMATRAGLGLLTWAAIFTQLVRHVGAGLPVLNFVSYFTILSNAIAGSVFLVGAYLAVSQRQPPSWYDRARAAATLYMVIVGLVFITLLRDVELGSLLPWINTVHHYVMPVVVLADWILRPPREVPTTSELSGLFVFPLLYIAYSLVRGAASRWYPYPFLNPAVVNGYGVVAAYVMGVTVVFVVVALGLRWTASRVRPFSSTSGSPSRV